MNEFLQQMFSRTAVVGSGGALVVIGATLWAFPLSFRKVLALRRAHVAQLRAAGENAKATHAEAETAALVRRGQFAGRILVGSGVVVLAAEFLFRQ